MLDIKNDTGHVFTVTKSGKVGIGTATPQAQLHTFGTVRFSKFANNTYEDSVLTTDVNGNLKLVRKEKTWGGTVLAPIETRFVSTHDPMWVGSMNWGGYNMDLSVKDTTINNAYQGLELNNEEKYFNLSSRYEINNSGVRGGFDNDGNHIVSLYSEQNGVGLGINISPDYINLKGFNNPAGSNNVLSTDADGNLTLVSKPGFDWNTVYTGSHNVKFKQPDGVSIGKLGWDGSTMYMYGGDSTKTDSYQKLYFYPDESTFSLESRNGQKRVNIESELYDGAYMDLTAADETGSKTIYLSPGYIRIGNSSGSGGLIVNDNNVVLNKLHNNSAGDSILTTDINGNIKFKALSLTKFASLKNNLAGDSILTTDTQGNLLLVRKPIGFNWDDYYGVYNLKLKDATSSYSGSMTWASGWSIKSVDTLYPNEGKTQTLSLDPSGGTFTLGAHTNGTAVSMYGQTGESSSQLTLSATDGTMESSGGPRGGSTLVQHGFVIKHNGIQVLRMNNNASEDSVLTTDANGNLKFKYVSTPKQQDSTWASDGINAYNKNSGNIGIGTQTPTAQLHTLGSVRFESFKNNLQNDSVLTTDQNGNLRFVYMPYGSGGGGGGTSYSFQNGITQFNGNVSLGGQLQDSVKINLSGHAFNINNGASRVLNISSDGNIGIGNNADPMYKMYVDGGDVNIGHQFDTVGRGSKLFFGGYGNTDAFYIQRYNVRSDVSELRVNIGDDGFTGDRFHVGYVGAGTTTWNSSFVVETTGKAGIGTDDLTGQLSIGKDHGVKLSVGNSQWPKTAIVTTGYDNNNGDYTDLLVPGAATNSSFIRLNQAGNVGIGTLIPDAAYKLSVNGRIHAKGLRVQSAGWSDFVFEPNYKLLSLTELEKFVKANKHLPEIPSTQEVMTQGQEVGEIQSKLLQKIEELTLYTIELNKQVKTLEEKNKKLEDQQQQISQLQQQLEELKKLISK